MDHGRRYLPPDISQSLKLGRRRRGWSFRTAGRNLKVSSGQLCHIERGDRVPSSVVAELLIDGYHLDAQEAERLRDASVADAGRASLWALEQAKNRDASDVEVSADPRGEVLPQS